MKATFQNTVDILVKAYLNDTLVHGNCHACAVGNLVAANCGLTYRLVDDHGVEWVERSVASWDDVFMTSQGQQSRCLELYYGRAKEEIDSTGYTWKHLAKIEFAFETAPKGKDAESWMFNGLMAVVDVLADIHGINLEAKESAKALFVKA